jgi:cytochrome c551/c552
VPIVRTTVSRTFRTIATMGAAISGFLGAGAASGAMAAETSGCVSCHLDEAMLVKNLGVATARKSAMQSGAG